jgi:hypothetical protein
MTRCNRQPAGMDDDARRRAAQAATNEPRVGQQQVTGKKDRERHELEIVRWLRERGKEAPSYQRYDELRREKIRLKGNGAEMDCGVAERLLEELRKMQEDEPNQFAELVRSVRPSGATRLPEPTAAMALARAVLKKRRFLVSTG